MNRGQFETQVSTVWEILRLLGLGEDRVYRPQFPQDAASLFRKLTYVETWNLCFREQYYDFQLTDDSLIQFRVESYMPLCVSYVYYECPYNPSVTFDQFLRDYMGLTEFDSHLYVRRDFEEYYTLLENKESYTPLRYDYTPAHYKEGRHPASHVHFGHKNNIRVGTKKVLQPVSFLCFILRQCYPDLWQNLTAMHEAKLWSRNVRDNLEDVNTDYWNDLDHWEMSLT